MRNDWHNHAGYRAIYLAALTGIYASPNFSGEYPGREEAAHNIAKRAVEIAVKDLEADG